MPLTRKSLLAGSLALVALFAIVTAAEGKATAAPGAQRFLWGAWIGKQFTGSEPPWSWQAVKDFEATNAGGRHVNLVHWGVGTPWEHNLSYWLSPLNRARSAGAISLVDMDSDNVPLRKLAGGAYDTALRAWAIEAKSWGRPFLLRFDFEMNGSWYPWGTRPRNQNTPADFVSAWRHMHDIFAAAGATNVGWVWCPNAVPPHHAMTSLASLYPGTAYVDWTCLDAYNFGKPWTSFARLVASGYRQIMQFAPSKPMLIGEVATTGHRGSKPAWIRGMFKALATRFPDIHGLVWFDKRAVVNNRLFDWPIETSRAASAAFSKGISGKLAKSASP
jgi:hypothetical protein